MKQEEIMQEYKNYFSYIRRPGAKSLLDWIESNGFFSDPASKRHHGSFPGGLAVHSINVFKRLLRLNNEEEKRLQEPQYDLETVAICGLLHDLCKIGAYINIPVPKGAAEQYEDTRSFPVGHGEKSVILILQYMKLTKEEILAIRWHMGQYDFYARGGGHDLDNAFHQSKLAVMLHLADMMATHFDEREETEE